MDERFVENMNSSIQPTQLYSFKDTNANNEMKSITPLTEVKEESEHSSIISTARVLKVDTNQYISNALQPLNLVTPGTYKISNKNFTVGCERTKRHEVPKTLHIFDSSRSTKKKCFQFFPHVTSSDCAHTPPTPCSSFHYFQSPNSQYSDSPSLSMPPNTPVLIHSNSINHHFGSVSCNRENFESTELNGQRMFHRVLNSPDLPDQTVTSQKVCNFMVSCSSSETNVCKMKNNIVVSESSFSYPLHHSSGPDVVRRMMSSRGRLRRLAFSKSCSAPSCRSLRPKGEMFQRTVGGSLQFSVSIRSTIMLLAI